jgi:hypothetical protein
LLATSRDDVSIEMSRSNSDITVGDQAAGPAIACYRQCSVLLCPHFTYLE